MKSPVLQHFKDTS